MCNQRCRRKVHADDVAPADRDVLTARAECVSGVAGSDRVSSIRQARESVTTASVCGDRRATPARIWADRPGKAVGGARRRRRRKVHADDVAPADRDALTARVECRTGIKCKLNSDPERSRLRQ